MAGMVIALALTAVASGPADVAASNGQSTPVANVLASLQMTASMALRGSLQAAQDLRSLYNVYQLQQLPEVASSAVAATLTSGEEARMIMCEIFPAPKPQPKKKCRT